jgi:hypothetical protein
LKNIVPPPPFQERCLFFLSYFSIAKLDKISLWMIASLTISKNWAKKKESKKNPSYMVGILFEECMGVWLPMVTHAHV